ncbi:MAG: radical SAM protein [Planctomycetes bacterium]|nr:radical SAM protein [Planctomycetota bacterium]
MATAPALTNSEKKARLVRAYLGRHPVWCAWQVTYRCHFRCRICSYWREPHAAAEELGPADFARGAANLARTGSMLINLAGGEPMLRPDLADIVAALARTHFPLLTTNGWRVDPRRARDLWDAGLWGASISIDYPDAHRHDAQRGVAGAWREAVRAVEVFRDTRTAGHQRVNVMAVLTADNQDDLAGVVDLAGRLGANVMVQPYGVLKTGEESHRPRPPVARRLLDLHRRHRHFLSNPYFLGRFDAALDGGVAGCRAGQATFNIDQRGLVAKCVEDRQHPVGSVLETPMPVLLARLRRRWRDNRCRACWYNCRGEVEALYSLRGLASAVPMLFADGAARKAACRTVSF